MTEPQIGELCTIGDLTADAIYHSTDKLIIFNKDGKKYLADHGGTILSRGYDSCKCVDANNYIVLYDNSSEVIDSYEDEDMGTLYTTLHSYRFDILDEDGNVVFTRDYAYTTHDLGSTTFEGEYIVSCNEGRIVTKTPETYRFASDHTTCTVYIYDMSGNRLATFTNVRDVGTYIDGELILLTDDENDLRVVDKNGNILRSASSDSSTGTSLRFTFFPNNMWTSNGFVGGYTLIYEEAVYSLVSQDLSTCYNISILDIENESHYGSIVSSKIYVDGVRSEQYYLVDLAKCEVKDNLCYPTLDAVLSKESFDSIYIPCVFGKLEPYALVTRGDQTGYLAMDGSSYRLYDGAGDFHDGIGIVKDGNAVYLVDAALNRTGPISYAFDSVQTAVKGGVFLLGIDGKQYIATAYRG